MNRIFLAIFFLLCGFFVEAQTLQQRYLHAKELYREGNYSLARGAFQTLAKETINNPFVEYASFFYALSSYHEGYPEYARDMLLQLKAKYPSWEKIDEANYWLARIDFENKNFPNAIKWSNEIRDKAVQADARNMKIYFLSRIGDVDSLRAFLETYPSDTLLARLTADKLLEQPLVLRDMELLDQLVKKYNLPSSRYEIDVPETSARKKKYKVGVLLPFMYQEFSNAISNRKNFVYEIYEGISLASDDLRNSGIDIEIFAYDTRRDSVNTHRLLSLDEAKSMDLFIGPISLEGIGAASAFSYNERINLVNPVSTNSQIVGRNPYSFLFLPSLETQARKTAEFVASNLAGNRNSMIIYGESQRDSVLAHNYEHAIKEKGFTVSKMLKIRKQEEKELFNMFTNTFETSDESGSIVVQPEIERESIGHIYVASDGDDEMIAMYLISALETRGEYIKIIGHEEWLDYTSIIPEQLERLQVHLVAPTFIDYTSGKYHRFRQKYLDRTYTLPTKYASLGYDMMMFFGKALHQYGVHFQVSFSEMGFAEGILLPGYQYDHSQDNQYVPIIRFIDSELVNVNLPQK